MFYLYSFEIVRPLFIVSFLWRLFLFVFFPLCLISCFILVNVTLWFLLVLAYVALFSCVLNYYFFLLYNAYFPWKQNVWTFPKRWRCLLTERIGLCFYIVSRGVSNPDTSAGFVKLFLNLWNVMVHFKDENS